MAIFGVILVIIIALVVFRIIGAIFRGVFGGYRRPWFGWWGGWGAGPHLIHADLNDAQIDRAASEERNLKGYAPVGG